MRKKRLSASLFAIGTAALSAIVIPQSAKADSSCTALLANKYQAVKQAGGEGYTIEVSIHREDDQYVAYAKGYLNVNGNGSFSGASDQELFSDRISVANQPFDINQADQMQLNLSPTGLLHIHYLPWNSDSVWDMSCKGQLLTKYVTGYGVVTLTFRGLNFGSN